MYNEGQYILVNEFPLQMQQQHWQQQHITPSFSHQQEWRWVKMQNYTPTIFNNSGQLIHVGWPAGTDVEYAHRLEGGCHIRRGPVLGYVLQSASFAR